MAPLPHQPQVTPAMVELHYREGAPVAQISTARTRMPQIGGHVMTVIIASPPCAIATGEYAAPEQVQPSEVRCRIVVDGGDCSGVCHRAAKSSRGARDIVIIERPDIDDVVRHIDVRAIVCSEVAPYSHLGVLCGIKGITVAQCKPNNLGRLDGESVTISCEDHCVYLGSIAGAPSGQSASVTGPPLTPGVPHAASIWDESDIAPLNQPEVQPAPAFLLLRGEFGWLGQFQELSERCLAHDIDGLSGMIGSRLDRCLQQLKAGQTLVYRSCDLRRDELGIGTPSGFNQDLGSHGIQALLSMPRRTLLRAELRALGKMHGDGASIALSLPFVRCPGEIAEVRAECGTSIGAQIRVGVFVETPAMALSVDRLLDHEPDHVFVGTKDLAQLTLGVDRTDPELAPLFDIAHDSVMRLVRNVVDRCRRRSEQVPVCVFADVGHHHEIATILGSDCGFSLYAAQYMRLAQQSPVPPRLRATA